MWTSSSRTSPGRQMQQAGSLTTVARSSQAEGQEYRPWGLNVGTSMPALRLLGWGRGPQVPSTPQPLFLMDDLQELYQSCLGAWPAGGTVDLYRPSQLFTLQGTSPCFVGCFVWVGPVLHYRDPRPRAATWSKPGTSCVLPSFLCL